MRPEDPPRSGVPPVLPSAPAPAKRRLSGLAIAAICMAAVISMLAVGAVAVGLFAKRIIAQGSVVESRQRASARASAPEAPQPRSKRLATDEAAATPDSGIIYTNVRISNVPWSVHVLKVDRSRKDLMFYAAHARDKVLGVSMIAEQARAVPRELGRAVAGVNGDFYVRDNPTYAGDPRGLQILNGDLISAPDTVCVWFDPEGNPHMDEVKGDFTVTWPNGRRTPFGLNEQRASGRAVLFTPTYGPSTRASGGRELILERAGDGVWLPLQPGETYRARVREISTNGNTRLAADVMVLSLGSQLLASVPEMAPGEVLEISTSTTPSLKGVKNAIAGGPELIKGGQAFSARTPPPGASRSYSEMSKYQRHPRSAVGWSAAHVYLVTVDGRQPGLSMGMTLAELAEFMQKLGCTEAMNLDGGKSAQLWFEGQIVNSPAQGEDTVANSLLVVRKTDAP